MAYRLTFDETTAAPYLFNLNLSRPGRVVMVAMFHNEVVAYADAYMASPERRLPPPRADCFRVDLAFRDPDSRVMHHLHLVISDAAAPYGILRVIYADDEIMASDS